MQIDKERAHKMIEYMQYTNRQWLAGGVQNNVSAQTDARARYSFRKFLVENNLYKEPLERNGDVWICCPFHEDASPSMSLNEYKGIYHCFSCDSKGNLVSLISEYQNKCLNSSKSYYSVLNDFLIQDKEAQAELGFTSIFVGEQVNLLGEVTELDKFTFRPPNGFVYPSTYEELADILIERKVDLAHIELFITLMQAHLDVKEIYDEVFDNSVKPSSKEEVSIQELLSF